MLTLTTLGAWGLAHDGNGGLGQGPSKNLALLVYLSCAPGATARREQLIDLLWADLEPDTAAHALRQMVWVLRRRLGDECIQAGVGTITLGCPVDSDRARFLAAIEAQDYDRAVALYGGEFLPGFAAPGGAEFENWADLERRRLLRNFQLAAATVARQHMAAGRFKDAIALAGRVRDADRFHESGWRLLLEALAAAGDRVSLSVEVDQLRRMLHEDRRAGEPATLALIRRVLEEPAPAPAAPRQFMAELVGREQQFTVITSAWRDVCDGRGRHVHVSGAAGMGKSRLLGDAARRLRAAGAAVIEIRANPGERAIRFTLAADLAFALAQLPGAAAVGAATAGALVALDPRLSGRYPVAAPLAVSADDAERLYLLALAELIECVTEEAPLALVLDDLHWADGESHALYAAMLHKAATRRMLFLTSDRPDGMVTPGRGDTEFLVLQPLDEPQVALLLASAGSLPDAPWAGRLAPLLQYSTLGSPLLIMETLRLALAQGLLGLEGGNWTCADPGAMEDMLASGTVLHDRVAHLSRDQGWLLLLLALAGTPLPGHMLAAAAPRPGDSLTADLEALERMGLVARAGGMWAAAHDEIADHAIALAGAEQRQAAHAALGKALLAFAIERSQYYRAAAHCHAAGQAAELREAVARAVEAAREEGDSRPVAQVVAGIVGADPVAAHVRRLVQNLPLSARFGRRTVRAAIAAVALLVIAMGTSWPRLAQDGPGLTLGAWRLDSDGRQRLYTHELTAQEAAEREVHTALFDRTEVLAYGRTEGGPRPGVGDAFVATRGYSDAGGLDVVLLRLGARPVRLTREPGDDYAGDWSPDGRYVVIATDRWSEASQSDLALIDPDRPDSIVRRLTRDSLGRDVTPIWSPDGTRIAFMRAHHYLRVGAPEFCIVTVDGAVELCRPFPDGAQVAAWAGPDAMVLSIGGDDTPRRVVVMDVATGAERQIAEGTVAVSHVEGWLRCMCRRNAAEPFQMMLIRASRPEEAVIIESGAEPATVELYAAHRPTGYLASLRIANADRAVPLDASYRLTLEARNAAGDAVEPRAVRWWSADTTVLTVDSDGELRPRVVGAAYVHVTAGGWRSDSALVRVAAAAAPVALVEDWQGALAAKWIPFGTPAPLVVRQGRAWLAPNGDSTEQSGVFSRERFSTGQGLGLEVELRLPMSEPQWQQMTLSLVGTDGLRPETWDLAAGRLSLPAEEWRTCGIVYPSFIGRRRLDRLALIGGSVYSSVAVPRGTSGGAAFKVRLQLFPDGRCGVAVAGEPARIINRRVPMGDSAMVIIGTYSHRTRLLVGRLELWRGVRADIDWRDGTRVQ